MRLLGRLAGYLRPYLGWIVTGAVLLAIGAGLMALFVSTIKPLVNRILLAGAIDSPVSEDEGLLGALRARLPDEALVSWLAERPFVSVPLLFVVIFFLRGICLYFGQYLTLKSGASVLRDLRLEMYESIIGQSMSFYQTHPTGVLLSRVVSDVERLRRVTTTVLTDLVRVGALVPFLLLTAIYHDWRMALVAIVALPLLGYPAARLGRKLRKAATRSQENMAIVSHRMTEAVGGAQVVQGFGMERFEVARFSEAVNAMLRADLRAGRAQSLSPAVMELLGAVVGAVLFGLAGWAIAGGSLDPGNFAVVLVSLGFLFTSLRRLSALYADTQGALAAAERVFELLDLEREIADMPGARPLPALTGSIRFDNVRFSYGDEAVLDGIDLEIRKGEVVALVGASGSGKSTLVQLLPRFYDPTEGRVLFDGADLREVTLASLREQIGMVTQETVLFDDTVRNNIAYGREDVPFEDVRAAAEAAYADEFVRELPDGYDTVIGEGGNRLSMGQRQRLTIARALLKSPPVLILDEATSALDAESEALVQRALERLMEGRTSVVIAHRLSTVRKADRILVLERGRVVEQGTHDELLARDGAYARLHDLQFREAVP